MALPQVDQANYPTVSELRGALLRTIVLGYARRGIAANVLPGSDHYIRHDSIAKRAAIAFANLEATIGQLSPTEATGDYLVELAAVYGISKRPAAAASGYVAIQVSSGTVTIPQGYILTSPSGVKYQTTSNNVGVANGALVEVIAQEGGASTNLAGGVVCTWDSAAVGFLLPTCTVSGGLTGGVDEDSEETLRERLFDRLSFPQGGGNVAQVKAWAESNTAAVEKAYVYAAVRGPASVDVALTSSSSVERVVANTFVSSVASYVSSQLPGHESLNVTTVTPTRVDLIVGLSLPSTVQAGGSGGGWVDNTPWPRGNAFIGVDDGKVIAYNAGTQTATVRTVLAPVVGQRIAIWNQTKSSTINGITAAFGGFDTYTVSSVAGGIGAWQIQVTGGFVVTPINSYASPQASRLVDYGTRVLQSMRALGPGEKTTSVDILPRGRRQPAIDVANPANLSSQILSDLDSNFEEIEDVNWQARVVSNTTTAITSPPIPATTLQPPGILVLGKLAFRAMV